VPHPSFGQLRLPATKRDGIRLRADITLAADEVIECEINNVDPDHEHVCLTRTSDGGGDAQHGAVRFDRRIGSFILTGHRLSLLASPIGRSSPCKSPQMSATRLVHRIPHGQRIGGRHADPGAVVKLQFGVVYVLSMPHRRFTCVRSLSHT
jgi:hypothetical protein